MGSILGNSSPNLTLVQVTNVRPRAEVANSSVCAGQADDEGSGPDVTQESGGECGKREDLCLI